MIQSISQRGVSLASAPRDARLERGRRCKLAKVLQRPHSLDKTDIWIMVAKMGDALMTATTQATPLTRDLPWQLENDLLDD